MQSFQFFDTQTMHIKSIVHNSIAMTSKKSYIYPGGIWTRVFCSWGVRFCSKRRQSTYF
jgi:hypothetical protein